MKTLTKTLLGALAIAGGFAGNANAQDAAAAPAPDFVLSGSVAVQSDYRFRGISQNSKEVTPEGALNLTGPDGFYVGTWNAKVNWGGNNPSLETDIFGGKHFDLGGTDLNVEAYYYSYPDFHAGSGPAASYYETILTLTHAFGPLTVVVTGAQSPQFTLGSGTGWYASGNLAYAATDWLSFSGTVGHQWVDKAPSDYTHFDFGATATWKSWSLDARYVGTDIGKANCSSFWMATPNACSGGFVATLTYNIADLLK